MMNPVKWARLRTGWNAKRWYDTVAMEQAKGLAVCDKDPLTLHFYLALWQIGAAPRGASGLPS